MKRILQITFEILFVLQLAGCSSDEIKRAGYNALYQNQCMREAGIPDCDPGYMSYDDYKKARQQILSSD